MSLVRRSLPDFGSVPPIIESIKVSTSEGIREIAVTEIAEGILSQVNSLFVDGEVLSMENPLVVSEHRSNAAEVTAVSVTTESTTLLTPDPNRHSAIICNTSESDDLYIRFGEEPVEVGLYSIELPPKGTYILDPPHWTGTITAIREAGSDNVMVTSFWSEVM